MAKQFKKPFTLNKESNFRNESKMYKYFEPDNHPNILKYYCSTVKKPKGQQAPTEYVIYLELLTVLSTVPVRQKESTVKHIIKQILEGVYYLHYKKNIVHQDLKPENIFARFNPPEQKNWDKATYLIGDFDLAKEIDYYNKLSNTEKEEKNDLYAIGCIMYWLLTGILLNSEDQTRTPIIICKEHELSKECIVLLTGLLRFDYEERFNVHQAINSDFITKEHLTKFEFDNASLLKGSKCTSTIYTLPIFAGNNYKQTFNPLGKEYFFLADGKYHTNN